MEIGCNNFLPFLWFRQEGKNMAIFGDGIQPNSLNVNILPVFGRTRASFDQRATANFQAVAQEFRISKP
jgi:hypothetical protein